MKTHEFTIIASGITPEAEDFDNRFYDAGCDDATLSFQKGLVILEFDREAPSFSNAVQTAYADVLKVGVKIERIEPDNLVSLTDIAERCGMTKQAISLYAKAERGSGFPNPVARVTSPSPLWDWFTVADWLFKNEKLPKEEVVRAKIVKEANLHLEMQDNTRDNFIRRLEALEAA